MRSIPVMVCRFFCGGKCWLIENKGHVLLSLELCSILTFFANMAAFFSLFFFRLFCSVDGKERYRCNFCKRIKDYTKLVRMISASQSRGLLFDPRPGRWLNNLATFFPDKFRSAFHLSRVARGKLIIVKRL